MENALRKDRSLGRERPMWRRGARRLGRAEEDSRGKRLSSPRKERKREGETSVERGMERKVEERGKPNVRREGWGLSRSPDPSPSSCPSPTCGSGPPRQGEGENITSRKGGTVGHTGQTGQERSGYKKVEEEDGGGPRRVLQKESRKRGVQSRAESRSHNKRGRERPNGKRRRGEEEEGDVEKKRQGSSSLPNHDSSPSPSSSSCSRTHDTGSFSALYAVGSLLGEGGCGSVYAGTRRADGKQVAIKYVMTNFSKKPVKVPGHLEPLPLEVALMELVCSPPSCPHVIQLLDWFRLAERVVLVLELPSACQDVSRFARQQGGRLEEDLARRVLRQVVRASAHCQDRGVLHRDIKPRNLLIQTRDLHVKLIDFGCGDLLKDAPYRRFAGTRLFQPPEWVLDGQYHGRCATVWTLGVLLFTLVCGHRPFSRELDIIAAEPPFRDGLSEVYYGVRKETQRSGTCPVFSESASSHCPGCSRTELTQQA